MTDTEFLAIVDRNGFDESFHQGTAVVVDAGGKTVRTLGDVDAQFLPRSALKPLFAASMLSFGLDLEQPHLALACASNAREGFHGELARQMAAATGITEADLLCPSVHPRDGGPQSRFANVCVGKHIAMAATAASFVVDARPYSDEAHPLQRSLRAHVESLTAAPSEAVAIDGCGAPVYSTTVAGLARAYRGLRAPTEHQLSTHLLAAGRAMVAHPRVVEGLGTHDTIVIERTGCIAKFGAEGTEAVVAPDGTTAVVKIADGSRRAAALVALTLLEQAGALRIGTVQAIEEQLGLVVRGGGAPVGRVRVAF